ncbi:uncharacterized protein B0P05DRAFT_583949 [Gilbertella persicaria]|uniref:uncharacterized protein n=1 Tax=Gilbertella persicaria TaxID=101096 RepID=UPI00221FAE2F|nr:uncharacterized protein B0P05DRAFT_583949 [Gilbertella persicaria]KAI8091440.1 hypothetical protein B0P05DRAFT_583949 [Gilbertella persicaria]
MTQTMKETVYRLKVRLALANFKRKHGYEHYDLYTLESILPKVTKHRYYPTQTHATYTPARYISTLLLHYPISEKRSTSPTEQDAANVLVMLHNSPQSN